MSDAGTRKRSRREIISRKPGDEERWATAQTSVPTVKIVTIDERRNVMRNLPDPKHFPEINSLMKSEVKKDIREMERELLFAKTQSNSADEEFRGNPPALMDTMPPQILAESTLQAKRRRYTRWDATPQLINDELTAHQNSVQELQTKLISVENEKAQLSSNYHFVNQVMQCHIELLSQEKDETVGLFNALTAIAVSETMPQSAIRRRRFSMKEVMEAWQTQLKEPKQPPSSCQIKEEEGGLTSVKLLSLLQKLEPSFTQLPQFLTKYLDSSEREQDDLDKATRLVNKWLAMEVDGNLESMFSCFSDKSVEHYLNILTSGKPHTISVGEEEEDNNKVMSPRAMVSRHQMQPEGMAMRFAEASNINNQLKEELLKIDGFNQSVKMEEENQGKDEMKVEQSSSKPVMVWSDAISAFSSEFLEEEDNDFQQLKSEQSLLRGQLQESTLEQHGTVEDIANMHKESSTCLQQIIEMKEQLNQLKKLYPEIALEDARSNLHNNGQVQLEEKEEEEEDDEDEEDEETQFGSFPTTTTTPSSSGVSGINSGLSIASPSILAPSSSWNKAALSAAEVLGSVVNAFRDATTTTSSSSASTPNLPNPLIGEEDSMDETDSITSSQENNNQTNPTKKVKIEEIDEKKETTTNEQSQSISISTSESNIKITSKETSTRPPSGRSSRRSSQQQPPVLVDKEIAPAPQKRTTKRKASATSTPDLDSAPLSAASQDPPNDKVSKVRTSGRGRRGN